MKQSPPATDLSGPKASAVSLTPRRKIPAVAAAVDFQSDFLLSGEGFPWAGSVIVEVATFAEETMRGGKTGRILFAHCRVFHCRSMWWMSVHQSGRYYCLLRCSPFDWARPPLRPQSPGAGGSFDRFRSLRHRGLFRTPPLACDCLSLPGVSTF